MRSPGGGSLYITNQHFSSKYEIEVDAQIQIKQVVVVLHSQKKMRFSEKLHIIIFSLYISYILLHIFIIYNAVNSGVFLTFVESIPAFSLLL